MLLNITHVLFQKARKARIKSPVVVDDSSEEDDPVVPEQDVTMGTVDSSETVVDGTNEVFRSSRPSDSSVTDPTTCPTAARRLHGGSRCLTRDSCLRSLRQRLSVA